jgi:uncharacterized protein YaaN involved in tellurite resistance
MPDAIQIPGRAPATVGPTTKGKIYDPRKRFEEIEADRKKAGSTVHAMQQNAELHKRVLTLEASNVALKESFENLRGFVAAVDGKITELLAKLPKKSAEAPVGKDQV